VAGLAGWESTRDLVIGGALLAGYAWLVVLSARVRALSRRLGSHVCREADTGGRVGAHAQASGRVGAAEILRRERGTPRPMLPPRVRGAVAAAEVTQPMPAAQANHNEGDKECW